MGFGIKALVGLIPGGAILLRAAILIFHPLRGAYLAEVQAKVLDLHSEKHIRLEQQELG